MATTSHSSYFIYDFNRQQRFVAGQDHEYQVRYRQTRMTFGTALGTEQIT